MFDNYHYDCESWCADCLPVPVDHPSVCDGSGEQDSPANCHACGCPLEYTLTTQGVDYVLKALAGSLAEGWCTLPIGEDGPSYYRGKPWIEVERDWARELLNYYLKPNERALVERFLYEASSDGEVTPDIVIDPTK